ncbi:aminoglycoside phosphotransferase family protein [Nocardioides sp. TF02-7]|uniref:phosphotransferase family protein n=1 Tax=Nocardioides sp. TF02-7 TaxID=2917724 RepID=UPI001F0550F6|nr:aminoglycoside phosphotransferase family protein [Nocardioides sp. TF02-7]UMG93614.1 aminoglycoside phosphotransferase family protein [Nocardioides sp. TF02-7]
MDPFLDAGVSLQPLEGGWSGETFLAEAGGERTVVRVYADPRHPAEAAETTAALLRLVRGLLPVPAVREVRRADAASGTPALLVTELLPGVRGDLLLPTLDAAALRTAGAAVGRVAAALAGMPTVRAGTFAGGDLAIDPFDLDLSEWVERHHPALADRGWSAADVDRLLGVCGDAHALLDTVDRTCLVHSDLNPKNLLLDPTSLQVTGVVDWEFAHSGSPFTDLGNVLRFDRDPAYVDAVLEAWAERRSADASGPPPAADLLQLARAADLPALVELASREGANPVADRAAALLREVARTGDLSAVA